MADNSPKYLAPHAKLDDLAHRFTYHPPKGDKPERFLMLREQAWALALRIVQEVPEGREQSLALTKLEEAVMWANAGIARE